MGALCPKQLGCDKRFVLTKFFIYVQKDKVENNKQVILDSTISPSLVVFRHA